MHTLFRYSYLAIFVGLNSSAALAEHWSFDPSMLNGKGHNTDISIFEQGGQLPGVYLVDIMLNGIRVDSREMVFHQQKDAAGKPELKTCLTRELLLRYGVKVGPYPDLFGTGDTGVDNTASACARLSAIPQATETFVFHQQQLLLSIPQVALQPKLTGIAPRELWNDGIPAFLMNYRASATRQESRYYGRQVNDSLYATLEPGINLGAWRLRNMTHWQKSGRAPGEWQAAYTRAERGLYDLKSRLTLGDSYTPSEVFDSVPFRGVMLASDEDMVPYDQRSFAPVVRGIARSQARIEVRQNGYVIYSTTVAPGAFALTDLPASGSGSDMQVTVTEADGSVQTFTVASTTPAIALREGYLKYGLTVGQYRASDTAVSSATLAQSTLMYGLPWGLTVYGGLQGADHYQAASLGLGLSLGAAGALSVDGIQAQGQKHGRDATRGQTWRVRYNKLFETTGTGFTFASYQYASGGFNRLSDVLDSYRGRHNGFYYRDTEQQRSRTLLSPSQSLGAAGYLYLSGSRENWWHRNGHQDELTASWSSSWREMTWSLNLTQRQETRYGEGDRNVREASLWFSLPLARWLGGNTQATYQMLGGSQRETQHEVGLNGDLLERRLRWDVRESMAPGRRDADRSSSLMNLTWYGTYGELNGGYSYSKSLRQMNAGVAGGVIVHRNGITAGQPLGHTVGLIAAPGVAGAAVGQWAGVRTDFRGYTTLSYLSPYQQNSISLDPTTLPPDAEIMQTDTRVVPVTFVMRTGGRAMISLTQQDGTPVPFGSVASLTGEGSGLTGAGIVGDGGEVYMSGLPQDGTLEVSWGHRTCRAAYLLPQHKGPAGVYALKAQCRTAQATTPRETRDNG